MKQSKTATLLASFSPADLHRFRKYLSAALFNDNSILIKLFDLLVQEVIPSDGRIGDKEELWKALFKDTPYHDQTLRRLLSDLTGQALDFRAWMAFRNDPFAAVATLLPALTDPSLEKHFDGVVRQFELVRSNNTAQSPSAFYQQFIIERSRHLQLEASGKKPDTLEFLEAADFQLDCFYFTQKLKHFCDALSYQNTLALKASLEEIPGLSAYLQSSSYAQVPLINAYLLTLSMLRHPEQETFFQELKSLLHAQGAHFEKKERHNLFIHLMNYCIDTKINTGRTDYFAELFDLYKVALDKEIIMEEGVMDPFHYKNIITVGLRVNAFEWTEQFIRDYTPALPLSHQANALTYNLAKVFFQQGQYQKVIEQLREVEYQDLVYALGAKLMLLKTYFELGEFLALDSLSDSFRIFLQRHKRISREVKQQYLNVIRFVKKLSNVAPGDKKAIEKIRLQVDQCKALADKGWIVEKILELA